MSAKVARTRLSISHHTHALRRPRTLRTLSTNVLLFARGSGFSKATSTLNKESGEVSSFRTKSLAKEIVDGRERYPSSILGLFSWTNTQLLKMGISHKTSLSSIDFMFAGQMFQESPKARVEWWQESQVEQYESLGSDERRGRMFCVSGLSLVREKSEAWQNFGIYLLECAVEFGDPLAALHLCALDIRLTRFKGHGHISQKAAELVEELAYETKDWRALAIRAEYLMSLKNRPAKLVEAFELANKLVDMTEAHQEEKDEGPEFIPLIDPWLILFDAAQLMGDEKAEAKALQVGTKQYNHPKAYYRLALSKAVKVYSEDWLEYMTKAAMGGEKGACIALGVYWLENKGWYPGPPDPQLSKVLFDAECSLGFDWLSIAAVRLQPEHACRLFLGMALVCRENNASEVGLGFLEHGVDTIEAGPGGGQDKLVYVDKLRQMIKRDWAEDWSKEIRIGETTVKSLSEDFKAENFLPPPRMASH